MRALSALSLQLGSSERTVEEAQASHRPGSLQDSKRRIQGLECAHGLTEREHLGCFICHSLPLSPEGQRSGCLLHCQSLSLRQTVHPLKSIGRKSIICKDGPFLCCFRLFSILKTPQCFLYITPRVTSKAPPFLPSYRSPQL